MLRFLSRRYTSTMSKIIAAKASNQQIYPASANLLDYLYAIAHKSSNALPNLSPEVLRIKDFQWEELSIEYLSSALENDREIVLCFDLLFSLDTFLSNHLRFLPGEKWFDYISTYFSLILYCETIQVEKIGEGLTSRVGFQHFLIEQIEKNFKNETKFSLPTIKKDYELSLEFSNENLLKLAMVVSQLGEKRGEKAATLLLSEWVSRESLNEIELLLVKGLWENMKDFEVVKNDRVLSTAVEQIVGNFDEERMKIFTSG